MPCRTDEPTPKNVQNQRVACLYLYALTATDRGYTAVNKLQQVRETAENPFASIDFGPELCALLTSLLPDQIERVVYSRSRTARDLANWWEDHLAADLARTEAEEAARNHQSIINRALTKLTPEERYALGYPS